MEDSGIDSDPKNPTSGDRFYLQENFSDSSSSNNLSEFPVDGCTRHLNQKLEQKILESKKLQKSQELKKPSLGQNLISIQRLSIPSKTTTVVTREHLPLVDWDTEGSDEEDIHFFPTKPPVKQELTDTFSIEEYQISPDEDDLNLLPPKPVKQRFLFCCFPFKSAKCSI